MDDKELRAYEKQKSEMMAHLKTQEFERQKEAAETAIKIIEQKSRKPDPDHPYLFKKKINAPGIVQTEDKLVIPVMFDGKISSVQFIDRDGRKRFLTGGKTKGCYFQIKGDQSKIYITEGYATGVSIHMATKAQVFIAFSCHSLFEVATMVRQKYTASEIIIAGDNDIETAGNPGKTAADMASKTLNVLVRYPDVPYVDFNDLHVAKGIEAVDIALNKSHEVYEIPEEIENTPDVYKTAPGVLGDIVTYYNATSGNYQPGFAVQTALAIGSVVCGRNFQTNYNNTSSLFFLNIGKSTTGKEHAKKIIEKVLMETDMSHLIAGDGYTSPGAVTSSLLYAPRHVSIIDEFAKYMQASSNQGSGGQIAEANSAMMQAFGRSDGVFRTKNYSSMHMSNEKRREMMETKVFNPNMTIMAMATPDDMYKTLTIDAVKDGFINRFIVCNSNAKRGIRDHKEQFDVPESIKQWVMAINMRRGEEVDSPMDAPMIERIIFSNEAFEIQRSFDEERVEMSDSLDGAGIAELPGRMNEIAMRIALICALARDPDTDVISAQDMQWAVDYIRYHTREMVRVAKDRIGGSDMSIKRKAFLVKIREAGSKGIPLNKVTTISPFSDVGKKMRDEILSDLEDAELIFREKEDNPNRRGPKRQAWKARKIFEDDY
jgi:hypothetical protein